MDQDLFDRFKRKLPPDPMNMDQELIELPQMIEEIAEQVARCVKKRDMAANDLKLAMAEEADRIRRETGDRKPSEKQIEGDILLTKAVRDAMLDLEDAKFELSLWQGLMEGARTKSNSIEIYAKLWMAGYLTPSSVYKGSREELAERRRQRPPLTRTTQAEGNTNAA